MILNIKRNLCLRIAKKYKELDNLKFASFPNTGFFGDGNADLIPLTIFKEKSKKYANLAKSKKLYFIRESKLTSKLKNLEKGLEKEECSFTDKYGNEHYF